MDHRTAFMPSIEEQKDPSLALGVLPGDYDPYPQAARIEAEPVRKQARKSRDLSNDDEEYAPSERYDMAKYLKKTTAPIVLKPGPRVIRQPIPTRRSSRIPQPNRLFMEPEIRFGPVKEEEKATPMDLSASTTQNLSLGDRRARVREQNRIRQQQFRQRQKKERIPMEMPTLTAAVDDFQCYEDSVAVQQELMADFNDRLSSLDNSISAVLSGNAFPDNGYNHSRPGPSFSNKSAQNQRSYSVKIAPEAPRGRYFVVKRRGVTEASSQINAASGVKSAVTATAIVTTKDEKTANSKGSTLFKETGDGGLKLVFDDDEEESAPVGPSTGMNLLQNTGDEIKPPAYPPLVSSGIFESPRKPNIAIGHRINITAEEMKPPVDPLEYYLSMQPNRSTVPAKRIPIVLNTTGEEMKPPVDAPSTSQFRTVPKDATQTAESCAWEAIDNAGDEAKAAWKRYLGKIRVRRYRARLQDQKKEELIKAGLIDEEEVLGLCQPEFKDLQGLGVDSIETLSQALGGRSASETEFQWNHLMDKCAEQRRQRAERLREKRAELPDERRERLREQNRIRQQLFRERKKREMEMGIASPEEITAYNDRMIQIAEKLRKKRAAQSEEQKALERERNTIAVRIRRQMESEEQRRLRRERDAAHRALRSQMQSEEQRAEERAKNTIAIRIRRQMETEEQRRQRRERDAAGQRARRIAIASLETPEEQAARKKFLADRRRQIRALKRARGEETDETMEGEDEQPSLEVSLDGSEGQFLGGSCSSAAEEEQLLAVEYPGD